MTAKVNNSRVYIDGEWRLLACPCLCESILFRERRLRRGMSPEKGFTLEDLFKLASSNQPAKGSWGVPLSQGLKALEPRLRIRSRGKLMVHVFTECRKSSMPCITQKAERDLLPKSDVRNKRSPVLAGNAQHVFLDIPLSLASVPVGVAVEALPLVDGTNAEAGVFGSWVCAVE